MEKPFRYSIFDTITKRIEFETNQEPSLHHLQTWVETDQPGLSVLKQTKIVYIDTRYEAKLRLWNYITFTKKGLEIPKYKPFAGTEIGKTIPILNF